MNTFCTGVAGSPCSGCASADWFSDVARPGEGCFCGAFIYPRFCAGVGAPQVFFRLFAATGQPALPSSLSEPGTAAALLASMKANQPSTNHAFTEWRIDWDRGFLGSKMEPVVGFEPTTRSLQNCCSTTELNWLKYLFQATCSQVRAFPTWPGAVYVTHLQVAMVPREIQIEAQTVTAQSV